MDLQSLYSNNEVVMQNCMNNEVISAYSLHWTNTKSYNSEGGKCIRLFYNIFIWFRMEEIGSLSWDRAEDSVMKSLNKKNYYIKIFMIKIFR